MQIQDAIVDEQARHIHINMLSVAIFNFISAALCLGVFWRPAMHTYLMLWITALGLQVIYTLFGWWPLRTQGKFTYAIAQRVFYLSWRTGVLSSGIWVIGICLFFPNGSLTQQLALFIAVVLTGTMSVFSFGSYYPSFLASFLPFATAALLIICIQRTIQVTLLLGTLIFIPSMLIYAWRYTRILLESLQLRFKNAELVEQLTLQTQQLIVQKEVAESATLSKSRFLAAASHDLRQPMHALNLYLSALGGTHLPEPTLPLLIKAQQCAQTMDEMFRALLDVSRLDASVVQADCKVFAIATLLDQVRIEFEPQAKAKGLQLKVINNAALIYSDPALLERILRNLVSNAVRYTSRGKILVGCRSSASHVRLSVLDTGTGIASDQQGTIFEEFYQVSDTMRDRGQGLGLGLAIVKRFAQLLEAPLSLSSKLGQGSAFSIDLPRVGFANASELVTIASPTPANDQHDSALVDALIAVIDDEHMILDAVQHLLGQWGCTVVVASSGQEIITQLSLMSRIPQVIICDYRLRGEETGQAVIAALHDEFNVEIPALLITGDTAPERLSTLLASGHVILHKPLQDSVLKDALVKLLLKVQHT